MSEDFRPDGLLELCADLVEGELREDRAAELRALLVADDRAMRFYLQFMEVHAFLTLDYATGATNPAMPGIPEMPRAFLSGRPRGDSLFVPEGSPADLKRRGLASTWSVGVAFAAGFAAAALLVGAMATLARRGSPDVSPPVASSRSVQPDAPRGTLKAGIARVIALDDALWESADGRLPALGQLINPGRIQLRSGAVTLAFLSGVVLSLEGPADLDLVSMDRVFCRRGRLRTRIPREAEGFVIASQKAAEFHFGTDVGLNVEPDGRTRFKVFEGVAEVALLDADGDPARSQIIANRKVFDLDPATGRIDECGPGPVAFVSGSPGPSPPLALGAAYAASVRESRPVGYWRFEREEKGGFPDEMAGGPPLIVHGPVHSEGAPGANRYVVFPADRSEAFLETGDSLWDLRQTPGYAVELWFLAESYSHDMLVGLFPPRALNPPGMANRYLHTFAAELMTSERMSLGKPGSVRLLCRSPADWELCFNVYSDEVYIPKRWHHLVAQRRDGRAELYLDGRLNRREVLDPDERPVRCRLVVGRRTDDPENHVDPRTFAGSLDELALYDHALTPDEVLLHHRRATAP